MPADSARGCKGSSGAKKTKTVAKSRGSTSKGDVLRKHKVYLGNGMLSSSAGGQECMGNEEK